MARLNPPLAIKIAAWISGCVTLVFLVQVVGCKGERSNQVVAEAVVVGDSMAPALLGRHRESVCSACGFGIVSELADPARRFLVCPNCGTRVAAEGLGSTGAADEVDLVVGQLPERWQVIGFQRTGDEQASVKRVIGLPGETVWFEHGDVFLQTKNGKLRLLKKDWAEQKLTRVLVHDNRFQSDDCRWLPLESTRRLQVIVPPQFQTDQQHWLGYHPKRCYEHATGQSWEPRIEDAYGFNQSVSRQLNPVNEVCVEFELDLDAKPVQDFEGELLVAIVVGGQTHLAQFVFQGDFVKVQLFDREGELTGVVRCRVDWDLPTFGISNIDQQVIVAVGDQQVFLIDLGARESEVPVELLLSLPSSRTFGSKRLRLWRDAYYFSSVSREQLIQRQAGTEGYFVVGDNLPVSRDSRFWRRPRVEVKDIIGVVDIGQ